MYNRFSRGGVGAGCLLALIVLGLLSTTLARSSSTDAATPTLTPQVYLPIVAKNPPEPNLFFDVNGNGLHDNGEPGLAGFTVCVEGTGYCTTTDSYGRFSLAAFLGDTVTLLIADPNADDPLLAMRYINIWHGTVVVPESEVNGVTVPEQHLNDTEIVPTEDGIEVTVSVNVQVALMQGFLTVPVPYGTVIRQTEYVDLDYRLGLVRRWDGITSGPSLRDQHPGIDYFGAMNTAILSAAPGTVVAVGSDGEGVRLFHAIGEQRFATDYAHTNSVCVQFLDRVERGQIIAQMGNAGTDVVHLHFELWPLPPSSEISNQTVIDFIFNPDLWPWIPTTSGGEMPSGLDPYRDLVNDSSPGYWVMDNEPQFLQP